MADASRLMKFFILMVLFNKTLAQAFTCPKYFLFEPDKSEDDKWYGLITLKSPTDLHGVSVELYFDKPVIELGNWFGKVTANPENTKFTIKNGSRTLKANVLEKIEIVVTYDPFYDNPFPQLTRILLNEREICLKEAAIENSPNIRYINFPNCGKKELRLVPLIVHGESTNEGEWPWHTAIYDTQGKNWSYICGGTLITDRHILTAAHCATVTNTVIVKNPKDVHVILGKYELNSAGKHEQTTDVSRIIVHSDFNRKNYLNDIAIIITTNPFTITDFVKPACVWEDNSFSVINRTGFAVGWGRDHKNDLSNILMEVKMPVVNRLQCILANPTFYSQFTSNNTFCAGYGNGTSVCNGDSGGGLIFQKEGADTVWEIRGIVSTTIAKAGLCDPNFYVIFTDVTKYLDWIKTYVNQ